MAEIKKGTTNVVRYVMLQDSSTGAPQTGLTITDLDMQYTRELSAAATKVDAIVGTGGLTTHVDDKIVEVDATSSPGLYMACWPDAAFATGVSQVLLVISGASIAPATEEITLVDHVVDDALDASNRVDVGSWLGTAVTLGAGAPDVNIQSTDDIDLSATQKASVNTEVDASMVTFGLDHLLSAAVAGTDITDDSIVAQLVSKSATADWDTYDNTTDSLEALRDFLALELNSIRVFAGTSTGSSTTTQVFVQPTDPPTGGADDDYNDTIMVIWNGSDKTTARVNVRPVSDYVDADPSFLVSPALGFTPGAGDIVEIYVADSGALSLLNTLSSGFGSTSPDRLIDYLRAQMSKTATVPSSGLGTFSPATDSLEALGECGVGIKGAGFATGTDSLKAIRDAIDTLVAPSVVSSSALSGSGFLSDCVSLIRRAVDEPSVTPKYTDSDMVDLLQQAFATVMTDIHVVTDHPIIIRHSITLVSGIQDYILPPGVSELIRIAKLNTATGLPEWESWPGSYQDPAGTGWKIEGNVLHLLRDWQATDTLELLYMPNAEPLMHKASLATPTTDLDNTALTMILNSTVTDGTLDTRENAYVGYMIRMLSSNANTQEERLIVGYNADTRTATFNKAFTRTHEGASAVTYEIVPLFSQLIKNVVCLRASIDLLSQEGNAKRMQTLTTNYQVKLAAMRRAISKKEGRFPHSFDGNTWDNTNRGGYGF